MNGKRHAALAAIVIAFVGIFALGQTLLPGCQPPVSDEAIVSASGRILDVEGNPMKGVTVRLVKANTDVLGVDWVVGRIVNQDNNPFRQMETDENGEYYFEFEGAEANATNQKWAAYFVAYVIHPDDEGEHMAVATDSFQFSNQRLHQELLDMHFWDIPDGGIAVEADKVTFSFDATEVPPAEGKYLVHVDETEWVAEVEGTSYSIPLAALEPCIGPVKNSAEECEAKAEHRVQIISLADGVRYRTAWHTFTATNPRGMGLWYRNPDDNTSGNTCSGKLLFDLNDGKFSGDNAVQQLDAGLTKEDFRCLMLDLRGEVVLDEVFIHNAAIWFHDEARISISTAVAEAPGDEDFEELTLWEGAANRYAHLSLGVDGQQRPARWLKIEFIDVGGKAFWQRIGEVAIHTIEQ